MFLHEYGGAELVPGGGGHVTALLLSLLLSSLRGALEERFPACLLTDTLCVKWNMSEYSEAFYSRRFLIPAFMMCLMK